MRVETKARCVSEVQKFAIFAQAPLVVFIATPELDPKLVTYFENPMILGHHSSKDMKFLVAVLHVCLSRSTTLSGARPL